MKKRPLSVTIISIVFILAGVTGIIYHASEWRALGLQTEAIVAFLIRLAAIVGGVFALRGRNWARWLLTLWIVYHVVLSFYHTPLEVIMHSLVAVAVGSCLFNRMANRFFKR